MVGIANPRESNQEQHDLETLGLFSPPFLPTESLIDEIDEIAQSATSFSEDTRNEQASFSRLQLELLAAFSIRGESFQEVTRSDHIGIIACLSSEFHTSRLDAIQPYLWLAGLERPA